MSVWTVYWITRLDAIQGLFIAIACITGIVLLVGVLSFALNDDMENAYCKRIMRWSIPILALSMLFAALIPSKTDAAVIYVIPKIAASEDLQGLGDEALVLVQEWLKELRPEKK